MSIDFLTLEPFMENEGLIEKKITDIKIGDKLSVKAEYGAGSVVVKSLHYDRHNKIDGVITDRGIFHPASFVGINENSLNEAFNVNKISSELVSFGEPALNVYQVIESMMKFLEKKNGEKAVLKFIDNLLGYIERLEKLYK